MTARSLLAIAALLLPLAACGSGGPVAQEANNDLAQLPSANQVAGATVGTASADGSAPANVASPGGRAALTSGDTATASERAIPAALQGKWGMSPDDCNSTRGDAKGLLTIASDGLRFYESQAHPARNVKRTEESISGDFDFTGEGQRWTKFQSLALQNQILVRTESSPMASFNYVRCT
jgi:predicted small lipoprotein YifL